MVPLCFSSLNTYKTNYHMLVSWKKLSRGHLEAVFETLTASNGLQWSQNFWRMVPLCFSSLKTYKTIYHMLALWKKFILGRVEAVFELWRPLPASDGICSSSYGILQLVQVITCQIKKNSAFYLYLKCQTHPAQNFFWQISIFFTFWLFLEVKWPRRPFFLG